MFALGKFFQDKLQNSVIKWCLHYGDYRSKLGFC